MNLLFKFLAPLSPARERGLGVRGRPGCRGKRHQARQGLRLVSPLVLETPSFQDSNYTKEGIGEDRAGLYKKIAESVIHLEQRWPERSSPVKAARTSL